MNNQLKVLRKQSEEQTQGCSPFFYHLNKSEDKNKLNDLLKNTPGILVFDELQGQVEELVKSQQPKIKFNKSELADAAKKYIGKTLPEEYGVWVYYPWSNRLVHILDEKEFIEVRTNRNMHKITTGERELLAQKKVGVVGLSVGQSVSLTMAMERSFGEIRLADFDILELSNLNRIRTGVHNLGISKVISVAREIAEIDPFIKVTCYTDGLTEANMDDFFLKGGKLDVLIEECDGFDIKVLCRLKARELKVPVLMEASDRGMLDVERYDLEPNRPILHGLIDHLDVAKLKTLKTNEEKIPYMLAMIGGQKISTRLKASMIEIEQTITTWPQLASAVTLGGGLVADVYRRLMLGQFNSSDRYYVDVEELVSDNHKKNIKENNNGHPDELLTNQEIEQYINKYNHNYENQLNLPEETIKELVSSAIMAPSVGNLQPWKWVYYNNNLYLFNSLSRNSALHNNAGIYIALGAATENLILKAHQSHLEVMLEKIPVAEVVTQKLVAIFRFFEKQSSQIMAEPHSCDDLVDTINTRVTNRTIGEKRIIEPEKLKHLQQIAETISGANLKIIDTEKELSELADIVGKTDRLRFMDEKEYSNFLHEICWTPEEAFERKAGVDIATIELTPSEIEGFKMARQKEVMDLLKEWNAGRGFEKLSKKSILAASAMGFVTMPGFGCNDFFEGGRAIQRVWLSANKTGISVHPLCAPVFLFLKLIHSKERDIPAGMVKELEMLRERFVKLMSINSSLGEIFIFRFGIAEKPAVKSYRKPLDAVLTIRK